ncbi:MAG TPA: hypothetical protein VFB14_01495 [Bryobacteraceae bacterium]|nr:hypothetical protein [Bryobacteraceae bacterium]
MIEAAAARLTAAAMLDVVEAALHAQGREWIFLRELRIGTGHRHHELQRLDAFALNCLPHLGMRRICYELKASRADFLGEVKRPLKRRIGMRFSNEFYFVTPVGMLALDEIPADCGLVEVGVACTAESRSLVRRHDGFFYIDALNGFYCIIAVPAPWRDTPGPTWQFAAAMLRNQQRTMQERPPAPPKQQKLELQ